MTSNTSWNSYINN